MTIGGADGGLPGVQKVIAAAPGSASFEGVWLIGEAWGHQAASPNVGLSLDSRGLTVTGPAKGQSNTIPWTWVQRFSAGPAMTFPDGRPATVVEVGLVGRSITLLVPPEQLREDEIDELNRYIPAPSSAPPPVPPPQSFIPSQFEVAPTVSETPATPTPPKPKPQKKRGSVGIRNLRLVVLLGGLVVVALVGTVVVAVRIRNNNQAANLGVAIPQTTPTTAAPQVSSLSGPAASAKPQTVADQVNLSLADLPKGWSQIKLVKISSLPSVFADLDKVADSNLASCLRLPLSHVGIITGTTEPGGPVVWPSRSFEADTGFHPSAISLTSLVASTADEQADLAALLQPGVAHCLDEYYKSSFAGLHPTTAPNVNQFTVPTHAGEEVIGLDVHVGILLDGKPAVYDYDLVVIGAGRLEMAIGAQQDNDPFPNTTLFQALQTMEARAAVAAGGH